MPPRADGLSEAQLKGVAHRGGPLLILGGAGTGKTRVLCERFTHLVESGTPPGAVLSLALTPAAAAVAEDVSASTPSAGVPSLTSHANRSHSTRVLPVPAPPSTRRGSPR